MVRSEDLGEDVSQAKNIVVRRVAIESQNEIVGCLVAPAATDDLSGQGDTRLCDVSLDGADKVCCVAMATRQSCYRGDSGVSDEGILRFPNWLRGWSG